MATAVAMVPATATLKEAGVLLEDTGCGILPVVQDGRVVGSIGVRDLAFKGCGDGRDPTRTPVAEIMAPVAVLYHADAPARESLLRMREQRLTEALVHDHEGRVVGVLSVLRLLDLTGRGAPEGPVPEYVERVRGNIFSPDDSSGSAAPRGGGG